jgi:hypothetical protein
VSPVIDTHTHLNVPDRSVHGDAYPEADAILANAASVGVTKVVQIGCDVDSARWSVDFAQSRPDVAVGVAIHPNDAARMVERDGRAALEDAWREIEELAQDRPRFVLSGSAATLRDALFGELDRGGSRRDFEEDLRTLERLPSERLGLVLAWLGALVGRHGDLASSVYAMAVLFALDRAAAAERIAGLCDSHDVVILDRYVASNAAYSDYAAICPTGENLTPVMACSKAQVVTFYIDDTDDGVGPGSPKHPTLMMDVDLGWPESDDVPLVENVEHMLLWWGLPVDAVDGSALRYVSAAQVTDFDQVRAVRLCLLLRSSEPVLGPDDSRSYTDCQGSAASAADGRLRRAFWSTLALNPIRRSP